MKAVEAPQRWHIVDLPASRPAAPAERQELPADLQPFTLDWRSRVNPSCPERFPLDELLRASAGRTSAPTGGMRSTSSGPFTLRVAGLFQRSWAARTY